MVQEHEKIWYNNYLGQINHRDIPSGVQSYIVAVKTGINFNGRDKRKHSEIYFYHQWMNASVKFD